MKRIGFVAVLLSAVLAAGCGDTGNPRHDRAIGVAEVGTGKVLQAGGTVALATSPEPATKVGGAVAVGVGTALEVDGRARIDRANRRESGEE